MSWVEDLGKILDEGNFQVTFTGWKKELEASEKKNDKTDALLKLAVEALEHYSEYPTYKNKVAKDTLNKIKETK